MASEQSELPAWLQSLRAGTQPTYSTGGPANFSGNPVDEGALPNWLQPGNADGGNTPSSQQAALRPSSMPAPTTDGIILANGSMSASSLIDEQSLPVWMREQAGASQGLAASSLVQPDALPPWLRNAEPQRPASSPSPISQPQTPPAVAPIPNAWAAPGLAQPAQSAQSMPPMQSMQSVQPAQQPAQGFQVQAQQGQQAQQVQQALSAQDLIDPQSLPSWLSGQQAANGGAGLSAASLLDMNALPPWLHENGQGQQGRQGQQGQRPAISGVAVPPSAPMAPGQGQVPAAPQNQQPQQSQQLPQSRQASAGNLAAASFIDMDALPDWLRTSGDGQVGGMGQGPGQPGMGGYPRQASFGVPPRTENVRVPGRPRGTAGPHEESEVAANVFASMLGVASNAPYLPGQSGGPGGSWEAGQQLQPGQMPPQSPQGMPPMGGMPMQGGQMVAGAQGYAGQGQGGQGIPGYGPQGYQVGPQPGQIGQPGQQGGYPMGNQPGVSQPFPNGIPQGMGTQRFQGSQGQPIGQMAQVGQSPQMKPVAKKRGFLDTIRDWFNRS